MSAPSSPSAGGRPASGSTAGPRASYANPAMRVSDAERAEVADRLSRHFGDGRLDQEEFDRRLHQAMSAVTQADLSGLFDDLPEPGAAAGGPPPGPGPFTAGPPSGGPPPVTSWPGGPVRAGRRPPLRRLVAIAAVVVVAIVVGHSLAQMFIPWVLIAVVVAAWLHIVENRRRRTPPGD
jgi:Flp pilus assembly protein TadB